MNRKLKKILIFIEAIFTILTLFACTVNTEEDSIVAETSVARAAINGGSGFTANASYKLAASAMAVEDALASYDMGSSIASDKKIIKTVDVTAETKTFDETLSWFASHVEKFSGNIDSSSVDFGNMESENYKRSAYYNVRIPADKLDAFMGSIGDNLNITYKYENIHDVTEEYDDTESRLTTLKIEEEKLNDLMKQAKTVEDMIQVEDKLTEIRSELDRISRRLKRLDRDVSYSTVNVTINEVKDLTELVPKDDYSKENIIRLTKKNFEETKAYLIGLGVSIITHLPSIIAGLICLLIILIIAAIYKSITGHDLPIGKMYKKNKKSKDDEKEEDFSL